ncbi:MAG: MFS transporter [Rhodobacteraceae bacterium]|nr:MAG: MFS transporter [Paracoccaceae bacterium]
MDKAPASNQFALLGSRRFLPLFLVQFLGAFNDQTYQKAFVALITFRLAADLDMPLEMLGVIASGLFILPFAIFTPTAGQIADRVDKATMMKFVKFWEIVVMALAVVGFHLQNVIFLYFVLFMMGTQSAIFAPIKYSVLPQWLKPSELLGGNGLVQAFTFLAIIFGAIAGNELILTDRGVAVVSALVVGVAIVGFVASLFAPPAPPLGPAEPVDPVFPRAIWRLIAACRRERRAFRAILAISWFWFLGATFLALLPAYVKQALGADEGVLTVLLTAFSVGVALGAVATERLSRGLISVKLPPVGALGIAIISVELWFATRAAPAPIPGELFDRARFFSEPAAWRILLDFTLLAACAGLYVTPLNAVLQTASPAARRARFIACSNVVDAALMVASAILVAFFVGFGLTAIDVLTLLAATGAPMAFAVARHAPETPLGRIALAAFPRGPSD